MAFGKSSESQVSRTKPQLNLPNELQKETNNNLDKQITTLNMGM